MKKYSSTPAQGFTLVELIVVIVILAILATIAFLSFGSQSAAARDSKRKTDLSNIASKMNIAMANGTTAINLVGTTGNEVTSAKIAGTGTVVGTDYKAGNINFNVLGVNSNDFKDADGSSSYKIGATSNAGTAFQLAASLENDSAGNPGKNALIVGNYSARNAANSNNSVTLTTTVASGATTVSLPSTGVGLFKKGDYVTFTGLTGTGYVSNVSSDLATLTLSAGLPGAGGTAIKIAIDESAGLVGSGGVLATPVVNNMSSCAY